MLFQLLDTFLGGAHALFALEGERLGHHRHGQDTQLLGDFCHHRCRTGAGATAHAGGNEYHIGTVQQLGDAVTVFHGGLTTDFRVCACTQPLGHLAAQLNHGFGGGISQCLGIGVGADKIHPFHTGTHHVIHGVTAATTDTYHFNDRAMRYAVFQFELHG